jgi:predicted ABC-type ATPase
MQECNNKPTLVIVAGPNGSGKTTITEKLLKHEWTDDTIYINPDLIAKEKFGSWDSCESLIKAADYSKELRYKLVEQRKNIAFETVFSTQEKIDYIIHAKNNGYFIRFFFVCVDDPTINAQRVALRVMEGGHDVPISKIIKRYYKSIENCLKIIGIADRAYFYDNTVNEQNPKLMFRTTDGLLTKKYLKISKWAEPIFQYINN